VVLEYLGVMDDETQVFLLGVYQFLRQHKETLTELQIAAFFLRKALAENPDLEQAYAKHYLAESQGPLRIAGDEVNRALDQLIQQLMRSS
jgi:hypothetical protein